ncbi:MAG: type 2 lanthipeptide synthetase LanM family protein [Vicinamibacteraceae bacterium]
MHSTIAHLTADQRQRLVSGASTVFERAALAATDTRDTDSFHPSADGDAHLRTWIQIFSVGDRVAFERRLAWDGLTPSTVARALSATSIPHPEPDWLEYIDLIVALAPVVADELARGPLTEATLFEAEEPPPFFELLVPALRVSVSELAAIERLDTTLLPSASSALERQLLRDLGGLAALAMLDDFNTARAIHSERYAAFTDRLLRRDLPAFFLSYPVLAKQMAVTMRQWVSATAELVRRVRADGPAIARELGGGDHPGRVRWVEPALSDPHNGMRRVAAIHFESGLRIVYKPRHVGLERAFEELVRWTASRGLEPRQRAARVLDRDEYGWAELVEQQPFATVDEVKRYYRQSGGLLCLTHLLRAEDLHMENVVATRGGPVLIDLELMLQPVALETPASDANGGEHIESRRQARGHCLTSGLLTCIQAGSGQLFDVGGLRGSGRGATALPSRVWKNLGSDAIDCVEQSTFETRVGNQVILDGRVQRPDDYLDEVCRGFDETYRFVMAHRDELGAFDGPLSGFSRHVSRVLPRTTNQYALLRSVLTRPRYQRDGRRWSTALDALSRIFSQSRERPALWPLIVAERAALEALDIPHFTVVTNETTIRAGGKAVMEGYYRQCGLAAVNERLASFSVADLQEQRRHLTRALRESIHTRFRTEPPHASRATSGNAAETSLVSHAEWIATELLAQSEGAPYGVRGPRWGKAAGSAVGGHDLYDGRLGPAVFFAALSAATQDESWSAPARELAAAVATLDDGGASAAGAIGGGTGLGSVIYGLTVVSRLLDHAAPLDVALRLAGRLTDARIDADMALDVIGGAAGALLGLLALYRVTGDASVLARAVRCGERLCRARVALGGSAAWPDADGRILTGFAHGAAGIACALDRLFAVTADERFGQAAADGYRAIEACFLPGSANWSIIDAAAEQAAGVAGRGAHGLPTSAGAASPPTMTAWCHGAPGIALAIALGSDALVGGGLREQAGNALATTAAALPHRADHVCCGNLGRVEALFTVGQRLGRQEGIDAAWRLVHHVLGRARANGHFCLTSDPFLYRVWEPGFFRGLSGIGYSLLRLAAPSRLPSIVAFETPLGTRAASDWISA